MLEFLDLQ
uniref:Uncharacterized protein n=1 Tax=Arundo donax TaxID=35708 RepID=A0A0A8YCJ6_ARUDO